MSSQSTKPADTTRAFTDPPPSYSDPSSYSILNGPTTHLDIEERLPIAQTPEYLALLNRLRLSMFLGTILLGLLVFSTVFAFYADFENDRLRNESKTCEHGVADVADTANTTTVLQARASELGGRMCIIGYTLAELVLEAALMQQRYDNKGRLWTMPCSDTGAFKYPEDVVAEFSYVVLEG